MKRGDEIPRPNPWVLRAAELRVAKGWDQLLKQAGANLDEAWVQITGNPRRRTERQHQLRGSLATRRFRGQDLELWQYEVTGAGRLWYLVDDENRTLWLIHAGTGHPKATD